MDYRLEKRLMRRMGRAVTDFSMLEPGDRVMVGVSGGKDSWCLLHLLRRMQAKVPFSFSIIAVTLDQGHPGFPAGVLEEYFKAENFDYRIVFRDTYSIVKEKIPEGEITCPLCSRLRRGILYNTAQELGATKIALGHHREDINETLLLNLFYSGQLKTMPPLLRSDDGRNTVLRPLAYCAEEDLAAYAQALGVPIIPCDLCGTQEQLHRQKIKALLGQLNAENPAVAGNMLRAVANVRASHLLDRDLQSRLGMSPVGLDETLSALGGAPCGAPSLEPTLSAPSLPSGEHHVASPS